MIEVYRRAGVRRNAILATSIAAICGLAWEARGQFDITSGTGSTAQDFDTLATSGTTNAWTNDTTLDGWYLFRQDLNAITTYRADGGGTNAGSFYSWGTTTERALGGVGSGGAYFGSPANGAVAGYIAFAATNTSAQTLTQFTLGFNGEQWRDGGSATPVAQSMVLEFGFGATIDAVTTWSQPAGNFDWNSPVFANTSSGAAVDGNSAGLVSGRGGTINGLTWATGQTLWIRWVERNDFGNDHGLAIDNFSLSWVGATLTPNYWDTNGASLGTGGAGTWSASSLTWNAQADGTGAPQSFTASDRLIFGGTAGTVTIDTGGVTAGGRLQFDTSNYVIAAAGAGKLTLGAVATIDVSDGVTNVQITAPISGTNGLIKIGTGSLVLAGANDFTGDITIIGGSLRFDQDGRLGNSANKIVLRGGVLAPSQSISLAATRNLSGSGGVLIPTGMTLTTNGVVALSNIEVTSGSGDHSSAGTLQLSGTTNSVGSITFTDPVAIVAANGLTLTGDVTTPTVAGQVKIQGQVTLAGVGGVRKFTVTNTSADVDFLFDGGVTGSSRLYKVGDGTLKLQGANDAAFTGGVRLGTAGTTTESGGRLVIDDKNDLGNASGLQIQFNDGTLQSASPLTGANALPVGISLGAGQLGPAIFAGSPMEFAGVVQVFKPSGVSPYVHRIQLDTDVTFTGAFNSGGATDTISHGVSFTGTAKATFSGATNTVIDPIEVDGPTVLINGSLSAATATVNVKSGTFGGNAALAGALTVGDATGDNDATLSPGDGVGTLSALTLALDVDAVLKLEINSSLPTPGADKLTIGGAVALGSGTAKLNASDLGSAILVAPLSLIIIENTSTDPTTGFFEGLPGGSTLTIGANQFKIDYAFGTDANDVALVLVPEPAAISGLLAGAVLLGFRRKRHSIL